MATRERTVIVGVSMLAVAVDWNLLNNYQKVASPWNILPVVVVLAFSAWLIFKFRAWFRENTGRADDGLEMLTQFRELRQQGELSEDEYRLIKSRLARATVAASPPGVSAPGTAKQAAGTVRQTGGTDNTGETGQNDSKASESSTSDESPNLSSGTQMQAKSDVSGMNPDE